MATRALTSFCQLFSEFPSAEPDFLAIRQGWLVQAQNKTQSRGVERLRLHVKAGHFSYQITVIRHGQRMVGMMADRMNQNHQADFHLALNTACLIQTKRALIFDEMGHVEALWIEDKSGHRQKMDLNPPVPERSSSDLFVDHVSHRQRVGHIDSGIDYHSPLFARHAVFDDTGRMLGLDLWDDDGRPFDSDTSFSEFYPRPHGRFVADILYQTNSSFGLLPVRYPRKDMARMAEAIDWLATHKVQLVMMPLGSFEKKDWTDFLNSAERHKQILFILSAGNNGLDIGKKPVFPAAFGLDNAIIVTSVNADGDLASGSNFSSILVDIGLPAENLNLAEPDGGIYQVSGTSFAVPRLAGFALCLLDKEPELTGAALKEKIIQLATPTLQDKGYRAFLSDHDLTCNARN